MVGTRWQNGWCIGCSFLSSEQQVRILPDPFAPEVIAEEHLEQFGKRWFESISGLLPNHFGAAYGG